MNTCWLSLFIIVIARLAGSFKGYFKGYRFILRTMDAAKGLKQGSDMQDQYNTYGYCGQANPGFSSNQCSLTILSKFGSSFKL